jgi:hypothetical protein
LFEQKSQQGLVVGALVFLLAIVVLGTLVLSALGRPVPEISTRFGDMLLGGLLTWLQVRSGGQP